MSYCALFVAAVEFVPVADVMGIAALFQGFHEQARLIAFLKPLNGLVLVTHSCVILEFCVLRKGRLKGALLELLFLLPLYCWLLVLADLRYWLVAFVQVMVAILSSV